MAQVTTSTDGLGAHIEIKGFSETTLALRAVDEDVLKAFRRRLRRAGSLVADTAARSAPVGRTGKMSTSYKTRLRSRRSSVSVQVSNDTPQGMILEFAGSKSRGSTKQGQSLIRSLDRKYGKTGRFMWAAYDLLEDYIASQVEAAVSETENALQARLDGVDG